MATTFKKLDEYLYQGNKTFVVPNYQRGYKWAVKDEGKNLSAVEKLMEDLIKAYTANAPSYFIQGITVSEESNKIILIDGQQRTTTLYLMLYCIDVSHIKTIDLQYDIRKESKEYINNLKNNSQKENEKNQDVYYFKKAIEQIQEYLNKVDKEGRSIDKEKFLTYILNNVRLLYIVIDPDKATKTFTMMNGSKATMLQEELIKAEMLRLISLPDTEPKNVSTSVDDNLAELKEIIAKDWETNALRSRYAREWDKWLYWWKRPDVQVFFDIETPMGLLLEYYYKRKQEKDTKKDKSEFNFANFRKLIGNKKSTKEQFKGLRDLQKSFEDIFNEPKIYNYLGLAMNGNIDKYDVIVYFIDNKKDIYKLRDYAKWSLIGATHLEITDPTKSTSNETIESRAKYSLSELSEKFVYQTAYDFAAKQLLRLNVEEDNKLNNGNGRKFDFSIYGNKSLEHIHPKSKAYHKSEDGRFYDGNDKDLSKIEPQGGDWLNRDVMVDCTEHSIGNLLLLDKNENSKFNDKPFEEKKKIYFNVNEVFKSRNLLHTIAVFAKSTWTIADIQNNQKAFIERFKADYNI